MKVFRSILVCTLGACAVGLSLAGCGASAASARQAQEQESGFDVGEDRKPTEKTLFAMARILMDQGRYAQAEVVLQHVVHDQPSMLPAYGALGMVELHLGKQAEAMQTFCKGLEVAPEDAALLNNAGMCCTLKKDYPGALLYFQRAVQSDNRTSRYRANLAMALAMNGRYEESLELYQQLIPAADAHYNLGVLCALRGDTERAAKESAAAKSTPAAANEPASEEGSAIAARNERTGAANAPAEFSESSITDSASP